MAFVVLYDANVLYPSTLRDVLIRVAQAGLVQAKWTDQILDETFRNLLSNRPDLDTVRLARTRRLMNEAIRDVLVTGYEALVDVLELPDAGDRHVLAAAIRARAQVIVTKNLRDFSGCCPRTLGRRGQASRRLPARPAAPRPSAYGQDPRGHRSLLGRRRRGDVLDGLEREAPRAAAAFRRR